MALLRTCVCLAAVTGLAGAQRPTAPDSIARLVDLWSLPHLTPSVTCRQFASTDPSGKGQDHGHFLRRDGDRVVLAEMDGPGVIVRLWSANANGRLQVFCDGESTPRIDGPFQDLFTGAMPPFVEPIAVHRSGGWISYLPIPYAKTCRVEVCELENPDALYYQVQYLTYPQGTPIRTFTNELPVDEQKALTRVLNAWRQPGDSPVATIVGDRMDGVKQKIPRGETREVFRAEKPGTVITLRLNVKDPTPSALRGLLLEVSWDGNEPSVATPLGDLFGTGFGVTPYRGLVVGWDDRGGYCHFPMPFRKEARITLRNASDADQVVDADVLWRAGTPSADAGAFHAEFREVDGVGAELYEIASIDGPGKFVGVMQTLQGVGDLWYLEGNEEFFVDGETRPSILGTGSEDYYNGGWYWNEGTYALPLHGLGVKQEWTTNRTTPWRIQLPDAVPFAKSFLAKIEHGSVNQVLDGYYSSVAFWYGPTRAVRPVADSSLRQPRLWVFRPKGFLGASELRWNDSPAVEWHTWEELTDTHRGLDRPLYQGFPVSYVQRDQPKVDARVAVLAGGDSERTYRATLSAPFGDRYRLQVRLMTAATSPRLLLDGKELIPPPRPKPAPGPLQVVDFGAVSLSRGEHELAVAVPAGTDRIGVDSLRLLPASPYVRTWWVAPPVPARADGTVADAMPEEATFLAPDFDPAGVGWKQVESRGDSLDLNHLVSGKSPMLAYLLVFVHAERARQARVLLGSDDGARVWVNGELCWTVEIHRHLSADEDQFDVPLRAGWNRLLVKVKNDYGGYGMMLRVADPDGTLRFATVPH